MTTSLNIIIIISVLLQFSAAVYSLFLIRVTGLKFSWIFISTALFLMSVRRLVSLSYLFSNMNDALYFNNEIIGLILSFLMLLGVFGIGSIFSERNQAENKIKNLLKEKDIILKEVHHRIKNTMNIIKSLLALQSETLSDSSAISALKDAESRVESMMVLYDKLYQSSGFKEISVLNYLPSLIEEIISNFPNSKSVKIEQKIDDFILDERKLQPLGIIINELLTNIMKYAFTGKDSGHIIISASEKNNHVYFFIEDNGKGLPESIDFKNSTGFGLMLVEMLTKQLNGTIRIDRNNGTKVSIEFNI